MVQEMNAFHKIFGSQWNFYFDGVEKYSLQNKVKIKIRNTVFLPMTWRIK